MGNLILVVIALAFITAFCIAFFAPEDTYYKETGTKPPSKIEKLIASFLVNLLVFFALFILLLFLGPCVYLS